MASSSHWISQDRRIETIPEQFTFGDYRKMPDAAFGDLAHRIFNAFIRQGADHFAGHHVGYLDQMQRRVHVSDRA